MAKVIETTVSIAETIPNPYVQFANRKILVSRKIKLEDGDVKEDIEIKELEKVDKKLSEACAAQLKAWQEEFESDEG